MGFTTSTVILQRRVELGDLNRSNDNRVYIQLRDFLLSKGIFTLVYERVITSDEEVLNGIFRFKDTNIYIDVSVYSRITIRTGYDLILSGSSLYLQSRYKQTVTLPTSGDYPLSITIGTHFVEISESLCSLMHFNIGWIVMGVYNNNAYNDSILGLPIAATGTDAKKAQYYDFINPGTSFSTTSTTGKHYLLAPVARKAVPYNSTSSSLFFIDEDMVYLGELYTKPSSLGTLVTNAEYTSTAGKHFYFSAFGSYFLFVD